MIWFPSFKCWFAFEKKKNNQSPSLMDFNIVDFMDIIACDGCVFWLVNAARVFEKSLLFFHTVLTKLISHQIEEQNKHFRSILSCFFSSLCLCSLSLYPKWSFLSIKIQQIDDAIEKCKSLFLESPTLNMFPTRRSYFNELVSVTIWLEILGCYWWWNLFAMTVFFSFASFLFIGLTNKGKLFFRKICMWYT